MKHALSKGCIRKMRRGAQVGLAGTLFSGALLMTAYSASAQLAFSPDCRNFQQIQVAPPSNAILFSKHPVPHPNGTATVFAINGLQNYVIPNGNNSCIVAAPAANDSYCFQARNDNTIDQVGAQAINNPGGLPACQ